MKILILSNKPPWPSTDGGSAATASMIESLCQEGAELTIGSIKTLKHRASVSDIPGWISSRVEYSLIPRDTTLRAGPFLFNLLFSSRPYNLSRFHFRRFESYLATVLQKPFDIIQLEGLAMLFYVPFIRKLSKARIVYRAHNIENEIWRQLNIETGSPVRKLYYTILHKRLFRFEKRLPKNTDLIVPMTEDDRDWLTENAGMKSSIVIPAGFRPPEKIQSHGNGRQLFFIGSLDWEPNVNGLKWFVDKVWPLVIKEVPDAVFHISGRNPDRLLKKRLTAENIIFHGEAESSFEFMNEKDILVSPLFSGSGLRMKIIEAMSYGKCIVASRVSVRGLKYTDGSDLFVVNTPEEYAGRIKLLINDPLLRQRFRESAIKNVRENYNIFASANRLINFYRQGT